MTKSCLNEKLRYKFDNIMSKGTPALIGLLATVSVILISLISLAVWFTHLVPKDDPTAKDPNFLEVFWKSLMRTLDPGTMGGDSGTFGLVMLLVTLVGIFIISALIGIINNGIGDKLDNLRKGRSKVLEHNHTVILGWSEQIFTIISELVEANRNQKHPSIVIMGNKDKIEMEEEIADRVPETANTRVICRSGNPIDTRDLHITSLNDARSIIILSPESDDPDAEVLKTMLAITNGTDRKEDAYHIVAELRDPKNMEIAQIVGKDEVELVLVGDLISRIIAQTCRQSGLSIVYTELLDFGGDEIYFAEEPSLVGKTFRDAVFAYETSTIMGYVPQNGTPSLNPPMNTVLQKGDKLIAISEDDDTIILSGKTNFAINENAITREVQEGQKPEKTLVLGWNWRAPTIINELDNYVTHGSHISVVADVEYGESIITEQCSGILKNQTISFTHADTTDRKILNGLDLASFNHIIILCYSDTMPAQQADAKTLMTLLHLRDIADKNKTPFTIVSEMMDINNRELAEVARVNDFIVSDKLISLLLAQISENKHLNAVFVDLFDPDGSEIYVKPAVNYVKAGEKVTFYTVLEAAALRNEIAIGYKVARLEGNAAKSHGVVVNPNKSEMITFAPGDKLILIAED